MTKRSYSQNCALAIALDVIGDRWTLLIVREVMIRPRRFKELQANLQGIGTNLLSERLQQLVGDQILLREGTGHPVYTIGVNGEGLKTSVYSLIRWGMNFNDRRNQTQHEDPDWLILVLRAYFNAQAGRAWQGVYQLVIDEQEYFLACVENELHIQQEPADIIASIRVSSSTAQRLAAGEVDIAVVIDSGDLKVKGREADINQFFLAFDNT
ncbi:MAG: hypothetical protein GKR93_18805 [Gammaproteobacteria bacterium]|nr:hypothetical protein [Gammaproteobacteria bacterium]